MSSLKEDDLKRLKEQYKDLKLESGINDKILSMMEGANDKPLKSLKEIKKELGIKDADIAAMFGYKKAQAYRSSRGRGKLDRGLELFYELIMSNNE